MQDFPSLRHNDFRERRPILLLLGITALFASGLWLAGVVLKDFVIEEIRRMSAMEIAFTALGHGVTILWFFWYVTGELAGKRRVWRHLSFSIVLATAAAVSLDLATNLHSVMHDGDGFDNGVKVEAAITGIQQDAQGEYRIWCEYETQTEEKLCASFSVSGANFCPNLQERLKADFRPGTTPPKSPTVAIRYDQELPARVWLEESRGIHQDGLAVILLLSGIIQGASLAVVAGMIAKLRVLKSQGQPVPWWSEFYKLAPLAFQLPSLVLVGLSIRAGQSWPWIYGGP